MKHKVCTGERQLFFIGVGIALEALVVSLTDSRLTEREREAVRAIGDKLYPRAGFER